MAQDKIFLESGDTLHVIISQRDDKQVVYVPYDDPEFNTTTISTEQIKKIQLHNGKVIDFKKSRYPGYYAGLCFGNGAPVSDFANNDPHNDRSGYATAKFFLSIEARMRLFRFIGLAGDLSLGSFGTNSSKYFDYLSQKDNPSLVYVSGSFADYRYASFSIGPDLGFNVGRRLKLFFPMQFSAISISTKGNDEIHYQKSDSTQRDETRTSKGTG
ncbi:MAG: hypothetical protein JWO58_967, partial [Chitinophagaceae bacterium]|nr:hypothetical protein [Chitinophagaceae bacterium]